MRVYLESLGCRLNAAEIESLARRFAGTGRQVVGEPEDADVIVLNSCAVTTQAARKSRHRLRTLHRRNSEARLAVTGCWATEDAARAAVIPGVAWVLPNVDKACAVEQITGADAEPAPWAPGRWGHTRAFVGVQDGCDHACTYCVTRALRGPASSTPLAEVVEQVRDLVRSGAQEVVLTGVSLGAYGDALGMEEGLAQLVEALLRETGLPRLRLSSIEPWDVSERLLRCWESERLCRQLHVPLQSGSDAILRRMGRHITTAAFARLVEGARAIAPEIAITTDVIVGFPGEGEAEFAESLAFVEEQAFARLHVFRYSERAGTPAVRLSGRVPKVERRRRAAVMRELGERLVATYRDRFLGAIMPVLWERGAPGGLWHGLTGNYLDVFTHTAEDLYNRILPTRLVEVGDSSLRGEVVPEVVSS